MENNIKNKAYSTIESAKAAMVEEYPAGGVCVVGTTCGKFLIVNLFSAIAYGAKIFAAR